VTRRQRGKLHAIVVEQWTGSEHEGFNSPLRDAGKGCLDVATGRGIKYLDFSSDARSPHLHLLDQKFVLLKFSDEAVKAPES
jgi:hypothetical protein